MRKLLVRSIPIITLLLFILIMNSDNFLKKPLGKTDDIPKSIELIMKNIQNKEWKQAEKETDKLEVAWRKVIFRVQFSAEKSELDSFDVSLARIKGAIKSQSKPDAIIELKEALEHWDNIGR